MRGIYRIGGETLEIISLHERIHRICADYCSDGRPARTVEIRQEDIDRERAVLRGTYSDSYLETVAAHRKIVEETPWHETVLLHGSAVAVEGRAYIFSAPSGTGKSTHAALWRKLLGDRAVMINDDKPLLHIDQEEVTVFGTPWNGKHHLGANISAPLQALCFLERGKENLIRPLERGEAWPLLLRQAYRPRDPAAMEKTMELLDRLLSTVRCYRLSCNMELSAAELSWRTMSGEAGLQTF